MGSQGNEVVLVVLRLTTSSALSSRRRAPARSVTVMPRSSGSRQANGLTSSVRASSARNLGTGPSFSGSATFGAAIAAISGRHLPSTTGQVRPVARDVMPVSCLSRVRLVACNGTLLLAPRASGCALRPLVRPARTVPTGVVPSCPRVVASLVMSRGAAVSGKDKKLTK